MTKASQELIARLQEAMHNESAAHSPRTTFAIEAMRATQTYIESAAKREAVLQGIANELSWSPRTREISNKINAALAQDAKP